MIEARFPAIGASVGMTSWTTATTSGPGRDASDLLVGRQIDHGCPEPRQQPRSIGASLFEPAAESLDKMFLVRLAQGEAIERQRLQEPLHVVSLS
jgi:hypothetical protein